MSDPVPSTLLIAIRAARAERARIVDAERRALVAIVRAIEPVEVPGAGARAPSKNMDGRESGPA